MVEFNFATLFTNGSQTVVDDDGQSVTITATFTPQFFLNGGNLQSNFFIDDSPDTMTLTFSKPVEEVTFRYFDLNSADAGFVFQDSVTIESELDGSPVVTNVSFGTSGTTANSTAPANTFRSVDVTIQGPFDSLSITNDNPSDTAFAGDHGFIIFTTGDLQDVVCFARDTRIDTPNGSRLIQELRSGDLVETLDHGPQPIRWIGSTRRRAIGELAPIFFPKGSIGNHRDLRVSPQHRMLISGGLVDLYFSTWEVLAPAKALVDGAKIIRDEGGIVEYFHILFDRHEIVFAEGAPSESFHPGHQALSTLDSAARDEILELFPELRTGSYEAVSPSARRCLRPFEAKLLAPSGPAELSSLHGAPPQVKRNSRCQTSEQ